MPESALLQISKILEIGYLHTVLTKAVLFLYMPESNQSPYPQVKSKFSLRLRSSNNALFKRSNEGN